jgi:hypothetical protein
MGDGKTTAGPEDPKGCGKGRGEGRIRCFCQKSPSGEIRKVREFIGTYFGYPIVYRYRKIAFRYCQLPRKRDGVPFFGSGRRAVRQAKTDAGACSDER